MPELAGGGSQNRRLTACGKPYLKGNPVMGLGISTVTVYLQSCNSTGDVCTRCELVQIDAIALPTGVECITGWLCSRGIVVLGHWDALGSVR